MNDTQWMFEAESISKSEERKYEEIKYIIDNVRKVLATMLGLDLMPVFDEKLEKYRRPEDNELMPLSIIMGSEGYINSLNEKIKMYHTQQEMEKVGAEEIMTLDELNDFMEDDGDISFTDGFGSEEKTIAWRSKETQLCLSKSVKKVEGDVTKVPFEDLLKEPDDKGTKIPSKKTDGFVIDSTDESVG